MFKYEVKEGFCTIKGLVAVPEKVIEIPETINNNIVCTISESAFENTEEIEEVILPTSVKKIGHKAFSGCKNLSKINLDNVEYVYSDSFIGTDVDVSSLRFKN